MAVKIRLRREGRKKTPMYRIVIADSKAPRDGYTLMMTVSSAQAINPALYKSVGFDPVKDFKPVALIGAVLGSVKTGAGADAAIYDPKSKLVIGANHAAGSVTLIEPVGPVTRMIPCG